MEVRLLQPADLDAFMETAQLFFEESRNRNYQPDIEKFRSLIAAAIDHRNLVAIIIAYDLDSHKVAGYSILNTFCDYTKIPLGDLYQFYVAPQYRGTGVSSALRDASIEQFKSWGCPISHVSADTGIDENGVTSALFANLWAKAGYKRTGVVLTMEH